MHGQNEDFRLWREFPNLASGFDSIQQRHPDVEYGHVRLELPGLLHSFTAIGSLGADLPACLGLQQSAKSRAYHLMVIGYEDANWHREPRVLGESKPAPRSLAHWSRSLGS